MDSEFKKNLKEIVQEFLSDKDFDANFSNLDNIYSEAFANNNLNITEFYEKIIFHLTNEETESAIKYIILSLDIDRNNQAVLHLCKTLLYGFSLSLFENKAEFYNQKFGNLKIARRKLNQRIEELEKKIFSNKTRMEINEKVTPLEEIGLSKELTELEKNVKVFESLMYPAKKEYDLVYKLCEAEEWLKILNLILEVCFVPEMVFESSKI